MVDSAIILETLGKRLEHTLDGMSVRRRMSCTYTYTHWQFRAVHALLCIFRRWEDIGEPRGNPDGHWGTWGNSRQAVSRAYNWTRNLEAVEKQCYPLYHSAALLSSCPLHINMIILAPYYTIYWSILNSNWVEGVDWFSETAGLSVVPGANQITGLH